MKEFDYLHYLFNEPRLQDIWVLGLRPPESILTHNFSICDYEGNALGLSIGIALSTPKNVVCLIPNTDLKCGKTLEALEVMRDLKIPNIHLVIDNTDKNMIWRYKFLSQAYFVEKSKLYEYWVPAPDPKEAGSSVIWVLN